MSDSDGVAGRTPNADRWQARETAAPGAADLGYDVVRTTRWVEETRRYRRPPGGWWLLALALVPALLAALSVSFGGSEIPTPTAGNTSTSTISSSSVSETASQTSSESTTSSSTSAGDGVIADAVFAMVRAGEEVTVTAQVPDGAAKAGLLDAVASAVPGTEMVDRVLVVPGSVGPTAGAVTGALSGLIDIGDFGLAYDLKGITVTGVATSEEAKQAAAAAVAQAWPGATIDNGISLGTDDASTCPVLEDRIRVLLAATKITFARSGKDLAAAARAALTRVADLAQPCADATLTVTGFTDSSGGDAINVRLSQDRAKAVRDFLVSEGVSADRVTATGKGSADPVADNDTTAGREANRRVEITVE